MHTITGRPSSITIFLADGLPDGLRVVEKSGWTGQAVVCPRSRFPEVKANLEFARTGVYVLCGPSEESDLPTVYVGEGDPTRPRLEQHYLKKDFWTSLILFTSKDENLNKAHVQYLESRLVSLARNAKRCVLDNGNDPQLPTLATAERAVMEVFLEEMLLIYPLLGLTAFEVPRVDQPSVTKKGPPVTKKGLSDTMLYLKTREIKASGYDKGEGFVVLAGSEANKEHLPAAPDYLKNLRNSLVERGVLVADADHFKFAQDYPFNSSSQAASVVRGGNASGPAEWKDDQGRTLKAIEQAAIGGQQTPPPPGGDLTAMQRRILKYLLETGAPASRSKLTEIATPGSSVHAMDGSQLGQRDPTARNPLSLLGRGYVKEDMVEVDGKTKHLFSLTEKGKVVAKGLSS